MSRSIFQDIDQTRQWVSNLKHATEKGPINVYMVQDVLLIWLDENIDENNDDCWNTISQLRRIVNTISTLTDRERCIQFLESLPNEKISMIISGFLRKRLCLVCTIQCEQNTRSISIMSTNDQLPNSIEIFSKISNNFGWSAAELKNMLKPPLPRSNVTGSTLPHIRYGDMRSLYCHM